MGETKIKLEKLNNNKLIFILQRYETYMHVHCLPNSNSTAFVIGIFINHRQTLQKKLGRPWAFTEIEEQSAGFGTNKLHHNAPCSLFQIRSIVDWL